MLPNFEEGGALPCAQDKQGPPKKTPKSSVAADKKASQCPSGRSEAAPLKNRTS